MRIYVQDGFDVYGIVYMLAPKDETVHVRLIWLPDHLASATKGVCHYELKFEAVDFSDAERAQWLDGLPELLINWSAKRNDGTEVTAHENVIKIEHDNDWEFDLLIAMAKDPWWKEGAEDFDILSKLSYGVVANAQPA